ncbi:MAG: M1 family metallopeptidase [Candidatus Hermodarchaeota archaeon]
MYKIKSKFRLISIICFIYLCFNGVLYLQHTPEYSDKLIEILQETKKESKESPNLSTNGDEFSEYNLSVSFNPSTSSISGNLSVNFYNNDPNSFTRIPFHLYLSGMECQSRKGDIDIINVTTVIEPKTPLTFEVNDTAQLLWVDLESTLMPYNRTFFIIEFYSVIPDGGIDRANSHGSDSTNSRIYKFTSFYPMPCVYDEYDGWNTDPYLNNCDPFYYDMANYSLIIEAPNDHFITATGELVDQIPNGGTTKYHFNPKFPVREVTFAASKSYQIQSTIVNGVNVSTYYLPKSATVWQNDALIYAINALNLFSDTFGPYPYSTLNIVEEYAYYLGMEYPTQVYASEIIDTYDYPLSIKKQILEKAIVHEIAHQWWYNLVGFDEVDWGFLDEGLTCWSTDYYARHYYSNWEYFQFTRYYDRVRTYYADEGLPSKINQSAYDLSESNLNWVFISYYKSPLIFEKISRTIDQTNFILGLNSFFDDYKFKIALLSDLQNTFENTVNESLDWLFFPWFDNDFLPKYSFYKCNYDDSTNILNVTIEDENEILNLYPYNQQVILRVYDSENSILYDEVVWINSTTTFPIPLTSSPDRVRLEYGNDVIVQLSDPNVTFIQISLKEKKDLIPGYEINLILIICLLSLIYLISRTLARRKNKLLI